MKICGIYKITSPNNKIYIGQSIDCFLRYRYYSKIKCENQPKLRHSILKYGWEKHKFEIICQCDVNELNNLEIYYMDLYDCLNKEYGLNLREGGNGHGRWSVESRKKLSETNIRLGIKPPGMKGVKMSDETKQKISIRNKGKIAWNKGKAHSPETRKKISIANSGRKQSQERIQQRILSSKGKLGRPKGMKHSEQAKEKMRLSAMRRKETQILK